MPQLDMFGASPNRTMITWVYSIDPLKPDEKPMFAVVIKGPRSLACEHGVAFIENNVVYEEVSQLLSATWEAYLFGEPDDVRKAVGKVHTRWKKESKMRPKL